MTIVNQSFFCQVKEKKFENLLLFIYLIFIYTAEDKTSSFAAKFPHLCQKYTLDNIAAHSKYFLDNGTIFSIFNLQFSSAIQLWNYVQIKVHHFTIKRCFIQVFHFFQPWNYVQIEVPHFNYVNFSKNGNSYT